MDGASPQVPGKDEPAGAAFAASLPATRLEQFATRLMLACVAAAALISVWQALAEARLPFQLDYEEGNILNAGVRLAHGLSPYPDPSVYPNALNPYGPVGYYLAAFCVRLAGADFTLPRLLTFACALSLAALILLLVRSWTGSGLLAATFALYFLATDPAWVWMPLLRVDFIAVALSLAGLWLCRPVLASTAGGEGRCLAAAAVFALAIFTKYTAVAAPAACVIWLAMRRDWKRAGLLAGSVGAFSLAGFLWMQARTGGQFYFHMFQTHPDPYMFELLRRLLLMLVPSLMALAPLVLAFLLARPRELQPAHVYLACAWAVPLVTGGKLGSATNHFLEAVAASCIAAALGYQKLAAAGWPRLLLPLLSTAVGVAALYLPGVLTPGSWRVPEAYTGCTDLVRSLRESPGAEVLSENVGAAVLAGKIPFVSNPFVQAQLERARVLSPKPLEAAVSARRFQSIVLDVDPAGMKGLGTLRWRGPLLALMAKNYRVAKVFDCRDGKFLLEPKPGDPPETSGAGAARPAESGP